MDDVAVCACGAVCVTAEARVTKRGQLSCMDVSRRLLCVHWSLIRLSAFTVVGPTTFNSLGDDLPDPDLNTAYLPTLSEDVLFQRIERIKGATQIDTDIDILLYWGRRW